MNEYLSIKRNTWSWSQPILDSNLFNTMPFIYFMYALSANLYPKNKTQIHYQFTFQMCAIDTGIPTNVRATFSIFRGSLCYFIAYKATDPDVPALCNCHCSCPHSRHCQMFTSTVLWDTLYYCVFLLNNMKEFITLHKECCLKWMR